MSELDTDPRVQEAVTELQQYLSDTVSPLVVADSVELLLNCPVEVTAAGIHEWTTSQFRGKGTAVPVSDFLFHAVRKLHLIGEFRLAPKERLDAFVEVLKTILLQYCPEEDRELLLSNFDRLGEVQTNVAAPVAVLHRQVGSQATLATMASAPPPDAGSIGQENRRLALLISRLENEAPARRTGRLAADKTPDELISQILTTAAASSTDGADLKRVGEDLRQRGIETSIEQSLRALVRSLPGWVVPMPQPGQPAPVLRASGTVEAMRKIVTLESDPQESARRFSELVNSAVEQLNEGALGRTVATLDLAEQIVAEKRIDGAAAQAIRERAHEGIDEGRLRSLAEDGATQGVLARILTFFPAFRPPELCAALQGEEKRERRRLLLALIEAHGLAARPEVWRRLDDSVRTFGDGDSYFQRNLLHLLRRLPRPVDLAWDEEIALVSRLSEPGHPLPLVKEAIANLGQIKHERAGSTLEARLADFERMALRSDSLYDARDLQTLLDRVVYGLARHGSPSAVRAVVLHGLKRQSQLGDTLTRLGELAGMDLSIDEPSVARLVAAVQAEAPTRVFGLVLPKNPYALLKLIDLLSSTQSRVVREAFKDLTERFPDQPFAEAARKALAELDVPRSASPPLPPTTPTLSGDLDVFGLPTLLQSLAQSQASGVLTLKDQHGATLGAMVLSGGHLRACRAGHLRGDTAFYQIVERPISGTFVFAGSSEADGDASASLRTGPREILGLLLEGMRRYDELREAAGLVPDNATLRATARKPTRLADETDKTLLNAMWSKASTNASVAEIEASVAADSYRIRRQLAHWVVEGALELK